jgi:DNA repair protein RecN (Recombination protein N)
MLHELAVENYAVVDRVRVRFHSGLNLLTGETGSGKSILVDALALLFGGRASSDMIRSGADRARVSGIFEPGEGALAALGQAGIECEDSELLLEREILSNGKARVYVNNRPATVALLKDLSPHLGDIHGQHDQQLLFDSAAQLSMLDAFADAHAVRARVGEIFYRWQDAVDEIAALESAEQEKLRLLDLWTFQRREIESAALEPGEDAALEAERRVQQNAGRLMETAAVAFEALYEAPESAWSTLRGVAKKLEELARIDPEVNAMRQSLEPALIAAQDVSYSLRDYLGRVEANPARLEEIETRLAAIEKLKRKYGGSIEKIVAFGEDAARLIGEMQNAGERLEALRRQREILTSEYEKAATDLSHRRQTGALELARRVEAELKPLAMERAVFAVRVTPGPWTAAGADRVEFLVSANRGEEPKLMERIASGGELSRIALALKTCIVGAYAGSGPPAASGKRANATAAVIPRTLVFDEIDTGIGGRAAEGVARRLKKLAQSNQVLCVTHLAQIACFADHHFRVDKSERGGRTITEIEELSDKASVEEIGRMLSGHRLTPEALKNAEELMRAARA